MYYELYIDVLFLENFLMDYLLLLITKKLMKLPASYGKLVLGALTGSIAACIAVTAGITGWVFRLVIYYGLIPVCMLLATFHIRRIQILARAVSVLYIGGFLLGGLFECMDAYIQVGSLFFGMAVACYYLASAAFWILQQLFRFEESYCRVRLIYEGKECLADAMVDSGNHLQDKAHGKAVSIISKRLAGQLFGEKIPQGIHYLPYRTIQDRNGVIPVVTIEKICIEGDEEQWIEKPVIGISERSTFEEEYDMIINPGIG